MTFIVFEGIDGAGKSTQIKKLAEWFSNTDYFKKKRYVCSTSESRYSPYREKYTKDKKPSPNVELWMFAMARVVHLEQIILPTLRAGDVVLCDRFTDSTIAYQHYGRLVPLSLIKELNSLAIGGLCPQLTLVLDVDVKTAIQRSQGRGNQDYLDRESFEFFTRVRHGYLDIVKHNPTTHVLIDGNLPVEDVTEQIFYAVQDKLTQIIQSPSRL